MYMENYGNGNGLGMSFAEYVQRVTQPAPAPTATVPLPGGEFIDRIIEQSVPAPSPPAPSDDRVSEPQPGEAERFPVRMPVVYADPPPDRIPIVRAPTPAPNGGYHGPIINGAGGPAVRPRTPTEAMDQVDNSMNQLPAAGPLAPSGLEPRSSQPIGPAPVGVAPQKAGFGMPSGAMLAILGVGVVLTMMSKK